jgi:hypothetical protein
MTGVNNKHLMRGSPTRAGLQYAAVKSRLPKVCLWIGALASKTAAQSRSCIWLTSRVRRAAVARHELSPADWRGYRRAEFPKGSWIIEADGLRAVGSAERVDLISRKRYRNFALSLEWSLPQGGNSGILYRVSEDLPQAWQSGPEMQLLDDEHHPDAADSKTSCGALYSLLAASNKQLPPERSFHTARVVVHGTHVEHWLNDQRVLACNLADQHLRALITETKFKDFALFAKEAEGHIVLQHHGTDAWFRTIHIEELPG